MSREIVTQVEITPRRHVGVPPKQAPFLTLLEGYPPGISRGRTDKNGADVLNEPAVDEWLRRAKIRRVLLKVSGDVFDLGLSREPKAETAITDPHIKLEESLATQFRLAFKSMIVEACIQRDQFGVHPREEFRIQTGFDAKIEDVLRFLSRARQLTRDARYQGFEGLVKYCQTEGMSPGLTSTTASVLGLQSRLQWPYVRSSLESTAAFLQFLEQTPQAHLERPDKRGLATQLGMSPSTIFPLARIKTGPDGRSLAETWGWTQRS